MRMHFVWITLFLLSVTMVQDNKADTGCVDSSNATAARPDTRVTPEQREALIALYRSTDGEHWTNHDGWLGKPGTECDWHGVICSYSGVLALMLGSNNLRGSIPKDIGDLSDLRSLNLESNHLTGAVPARIASLSELEELRLYDNDLTGLLPKPLIRKWQEGKMTINAADSLLTDISEIDFEVFQPSTLCSQHRVILHSNSEATLYTTRCRKTTPEDRETYCEVKHGRVYGFAPLAQLIEKNDFFGFLPDYSDTVTNSAFESLRVTRAGTTYEVVDYAGAGPFELWTIHRVIEGVSSSIEWDETTRQAECPKWEK